MLRITCPFCGERDYTEFRYGGDASLIRIDEGNFDYVDVTGEHLAGTKRISAQGIIIRGEWWE